MDTDAVFADTPIAISPVRSSATVVTIFVSAPTPRPPAATTAISPSTAALSTGG